jgi:hypothetical protein
VTEPRDGTSEDALGTDAPIDEGAPDEIDGDELVDDLADEAETDELDDYEAAVREVAGDDTDDRWRVEPGAPSTEAAAATGVAARRRGVAASPSRAPSPSEIAVHVREDVSKYFVIATAAVFALILLNAIFLGTGGLLRPLATPTPEPSASPSASASGSPASSPSSSATAAPSPPGSAGPTLSASPSAS